MTTNTPTDTPTKLQTLRTSLGIAVDRCFRGAILVETEADVVLAKRSYAPHGEDKCYLITHSILACGEYSFYWSTYDLTLDEAIIIYSKKVATKLAR